jgi:hypothetical protein
MGNNCCFPPAHFRIGRGDGKIETFDFNSIAIYIFYFVYVFRLTFSWLAQKGKEIKVFSCSFSISYGISCLIEILPWQFFLEALWSRELGA